MPQNPCPLCEPGPMLVVCVVPDLANVETGGWCNPCALPSVLTIPVAVRCPHGWPLGPLGAVQVCDECGAQTKAGRRDA